jgi:hypothetical protein
MRYPNEKEIIASIRIEKNFILVRREGGRTTTDAGLTLAGGGLKSPFSKIIAFGPDYKGSFKKGDRLLYSEGHVIPEIDVGDDKKGNLSFVNPDKVIGSVSHELFENKNGEAQATQTNV